MNYLMKRKDFHESKPYRVRCEVYIVKNGKIFVGIDKKSKLIAIPGGGQEENESFQEAAIREAKEEIGISCKNLKYIHKPFKFEFDNGKWAGKYKGMVIHSFKADYDGEDKEEYGGGPEGEYKIQLLSKEDVIKKLNSRKDIAQKWDKIRIDYQIKLVKNL